MNVLTHPLLWLFTGGGATYLLNYRSNRRMARAEAEIKEIEADRMKFEALSRAYEEMQAMLEKQTAVYCEFREEMFAKVENLEKLVCARRKCYRRKSVDGNGGDHVAEC